MSDPKRDPTKKHRHDVGAVDHGPVTGQGPTHTLQAMLGICIVLSAALTIYALLHAVWGISAP